MSRYSVLIDLNTTGVDELNKIERQILQLQAQGNKPINLKIDVDGNIKNISSIFDSIEKQAVQSGKNISKALQKGMKGFTFNSKDPYFDKFFKQLEVDEKNIDKLSREYNVNPKDARKAYDSYNREIENALNRRKKQKEANDKSVEKMEQAREQSILNRKKREERLAQAQNDAINKSLENDYKNQVKNREKQINSASKHLESLKKDLSKAISKNDYADSGSTKKANDLMQMISSTDLEAYNKPLQRVEELTNRVNSAIEKLSQSHKNALDKLNKEIAAEDEANGRALVDAWKQADEYNRNKQQYTQEQKKLLAEGKKQEEAYYKSVDEIQKRANSGEFELRNAKMDAFESKYDGQNNDALNRVKSTIKEIKQLQKELQTGIYESGDKKGLKIVSDDQILKMQQLDTAIDKLNNGMKEVGVTMSKSVDTNIIRRSIDSIDTYMQKNTRALKDYQGVLQDIQNDFRNAKTQDDYIAANNRWKNTQAEISAKGLTGNSFMNEMGRAFKQISEFVGVYGILQNIAYEIPAQMVQAVKDVNAAQIELTKVSNAPTSELSAYWDEAAVSAKKYGATISDVISSTADWQRLGYDFEASKKLSDATTLMQKVGDNMTQESASKGIISTLSGFKMDADEVTKVIDVVNEIANTQPIDTAGIFEGLERSASSMSAANNSLEETVALLSAANSVVQNPAELGTAFKTISMRLRGKNVPPYKESLYAMCA